MLKINDASNFRRTVAGLCLIAAPVALAMALLIGPDQGEAGLVETIAAHPGRTEVESLLIILSTVLFVPALMGILNLTRSRGITLVHAGVGLMTIGVIGHAVWAGFQFVLLMLIESNIGRTQLVAALEGGEPPTAGFVVVLAMFLVGFFLGLLVLAAGLWRSRIIPKWVPVGLALTAVSDFIPVPGGEMVFAIVSFLATALAAVCFGAIGLKLLTMSDADWERGPAPSAETLNGGNPEPRVQ